MKTILQAGWVACTAMAAMTIAGCGGAPLRVAALDDVERVRGTAAAKEGAERAPELYARAEQERDIARRAHDSGDDVAATLHAERAIAAYGHALAVARLAVAMVEQADAQKASDDTAVEQQSLDAARAGLDRDAVELEQRAKVARDRLLPAASADASGDREAARLTAARSLAVDARLLCDAARLVGGDAVVADGESALAKLEQRLAGKPHPAPIDDAGAARARCLDALTRARRAAGDGGERTDALLSELSASGGWDPVRDERGVVVTLRGVFRGVGLTEDGVAKLGSLGRVAAAHPSFAVQLVVHDAQTPAAKDPTDSHRADAAIQALVAGGATPARVKGELAGARAPIVDPSNARDRARNERVDVVFVAGS